MVSPYGPGETNPRHSTCMRLMGRRIPFAVKPYSDLGEGGHIESSWRREEDRQRVVPEYRFPVNIGKRHQR